MKRIAFVVACAALSFSITAQATSKDAVLFKTVGSWSIYSDRTMGNSCFAASIFEGGIILRFGFQKPDSASAFYISFGSTKWHSLEDGKDYRISMQMDNEPKWNATASAGRIGEVPFLFVSTNEADFIIELVRKHGIRVEYQGRQIGHLSLKGSAAAARALVECQEAVKLLEEYSPPKTTDDPFSVKPNSNNSDDPFA